MTSSFCMQRNHSSFSHIPLILAVKCAVSRAGKQNQCNRLRYCNSSNSVDFVTWWSAKGASFCPNISQTWHTRSYDFRQSALTVVCISHIFHLQFSCPCDVSQLLRRSCWHRALSLRKLSVLLHKCYAWTKIIRFVTCHICHLCIGQACFVSPCICVY